MEYLTPGILAHEAVHACLSRLFFIGSNDKDWNEEELASTVEYVTDFAFKAWQRVKRGKRND